MYYVRYKYWLIEMGIIEYNTKIIEHVDYRLK